MTALAAALAHLALDRALARREITLGAYRTASLELRASVKE